MKGKHRLLIIVACLFVGLLSFAFRPVPIPTSDADCLVTTGIVSNISAMGEKDVRFTIEGQKGTFYINRGLERGLNLSDLKSTLTGHEITLKYPKYWTPLDPTNHTRHVSKLEYQGKTLFSEIAK